MRIVSLIASATEILHALGLGEYQVGRSHECDFPEPVRRLPVCTRPRFDVSGSSADIDRRVKTALAEAGSVYEVFGEVLEQLRPTHLLTQTQCKVCAVSRDDVERALAGSLATRPVVVALEPNSLADVWNDIERIGEACGVPAAARQLTAGIQERLGNLARPSIPARVACLEWLEPLMAAGNWMPELVEAAGGTDVFGGAGEPSRWISWDDLRAADPDVIVAMPCGFDLERTASEMHWLTGHPAWGRLRAVQAGRVFIADANQYFTRPGPRLAESAQMLVEILSGTMSRTDRTGVRPYSIRCIGS